MAFIGVRISWLTLERNSLLARLARSASCKARSRASLLLRSATTESVISVRAMHTRPSRKSMAVIVARLTLAGK